MELRERKTGGGLIGPVTAGVAGLLLCYFLVFGLILLDEGILRTNYVHAALEHISPDAYERVGEYFGVLYAPLIWLVKKIGLV